MKPKYIVVITCFILQITSTVLAEFDHQHQVFNKILGQHVVIQGAKSLVNYKAIKTNPSELNSYINSIENLTVSSFNQFSEKQQLAFLVNAYNALTIKLIVDNFPVNSIKDLGSLFKSAWKKKFFKLFGKQQYLDHIEHELLRVNYKEPRIHFALVCASKGCPPLRNEAYTAAKLDQQFETATVQFLNDPDRNYFRNQTLYISKIFKWFAKDFIQTSGSVAAFVVPRMSSVADKKTALNARLSYLDYDWSLNDSSK